MAGYCVADQGGKSHLCVESRKAAALHLLTLRPAVHVCANVARELCCLLQDNWKHYWLLLLLCMLLLERSISESAVP